MITVGLAGDIITDVPQPNAIVLLRLLYRDSLACDPWNVRRFACRDIMFALPVSILPVPGDLVGADLIRSGEDFSFSAGTMRAVELPERPCMTTPEAGPSREGGRPWDTRVPC